MHVNATTIWNTLQVPEVREAIEAAHKAATADLCEKMSALAAEMLELQADIARGRPGEDGSPTVPESVRRQAITDLLDRCGVVRTSKVEQEIHDDRPASDEEAIEELALVLPDPEDEDEAESA
jgi:thymidine phosphorylase